MLLATTTTPAPTTTDICQKLHYYPLLSKLAKWKGICPHFHHFHHFNNHFNYHTNPYQYLDPLKQYTSPAPYPIKYKSISPQHQVNFHTKLPETLKGFTPKHPTFTSGLAHEYTIRGQANFYSRLPEKVKLYSKPTEQIPHQKPYQLLGLEQFRPASYQEDEKDVEHTTRPPDPIQQYVNVVSSKVEFQFARKKR